MTDNDPVVETTARIGEHTATVRVLDTGAVKLTPRMAGQLDTVQLDALDAFGRVRILDRQGYRTVLIGKDRDGSLALADLPRVREPLALYSAADGPKPHIGAEVRSKFMAPDMAPATVEFEGWTCFIDSYFYDRVTDGSLAVGEFDPNGNEQTFREQIAELAHLKVLVKELLELPRILLRED